jgi:hypothetical protein
LGVTVLGECIDSSATRLSFDGWEIVEGGGLEPALNEGSFSLSDFNCVSLHPPGFQPQNARDEARSTRRSRIPSRPRGA